MCRLLATFLEHSGLERAVLERAGLDRAGLDRAGSFEVVGSVNRGKNVLAKIKELRPDVATLGPNFPDLDGLHVLASVRTEEPVPVVVVTGASGSFAFRVAEAMDLGAADYVLKFIPGQSARPEDIARRIVAKLRSAAATKVIRLRRAGSEFASQSRPVLLFQVISPPARS